MVHVSADVAVKRRVSSLDIRLVLAALNAAGTITRVIPRYPAGDVISRFAGCLWFLFARRARDSVRDNLRHVLGREPTRLEILRVFQHGALNYWDTFALPHSTYEQLIELVDLHGLEHIESARSQGRGVICAGPHLGSVAFVSQVLPALGYPVVGLVEPFDPPEVFDFFARQRQALGTRLWPAGTPGVRQLLLSLRRNEVVGLVTDRDITGNGPIIPFFGAMTHFPDGAAVLSLRTGAPILIAVAVRKAHGRFDGWIEPLPPVERTGDAKQDALLVTRAVAERLEYYVANHPEQWTVFQRRWDRVSRGAT